MPKSASKVCAYYFNKFSSLQPDYSAFLMIHDAHTKFDAKHFNVYRKIKSKLLFDQQWIKKIWPKKQHIVSWILIKHFLDTHVAWPHSAVGSVSDSITIGPEFDARSGNILSVPLPLNQEEQLSVTGKSMCS